MERRIDRRPLLLGDRRNTRAWRGPNGWSAYSRSRLQLAANGAATSARDL